MRPVHLFNYAYLLMLRWDGNLRRGGRVVERARLEIGFGVKANVGSNPTLSVSEVKTLVIVGFNNR